MSEKRLWLKGKRAEKDMSQDEVAKALGISRVSYNRIEQGHTTKMRYDIVLKLSKILGFNAEDFE